MFGVDVFDGAAVGGDVAGKVPCVPENGLYEGMKEEGVNE